MTTPPAAPAWSAADLEGRLCRALDLASTVVDDFGAEGYRDDELPALSFGPEKVVAESAMLAHVAARVDSATVRQRAGALAAQLAPLARSPRVLADAALEPGRAFTYAVPHVLLTGLGQAHDECDRFLRQRCEQALTTFRDLPPSAELERAWISRLWGWAEAGSPLLAGPHFARLPAICGGGREDAYAFTHQLFYLTDFGEQPRIRLACAQEELLARVEGLVLRFLDAEDYDLVGELLMTWPELGARWTPTATFAFRVLARVEDEVGVLPCGNADAERLGRLTGSERTRYARATGYHTAFVMGFLCAAVLNSGALPPTAINGRPEPRACWPELWARLDLSQGHWLADFVHANSAEQQVLAPTLGALVALQRLRVHDYAGLADVLRTNGGWLLPSVVAAALDRVAAVADATGIAAG